MHLLQNEHARDARDRDAAENDDDQADHAEVVLRRSKSRPISSSDDRYERALMNSSLKSARSVRTSGSIRSSGSSDQQHVAGAAAEGQQTRGGQIGGIDEDARTEAEIADAAAGLVRDDAANGEGRLADRDLVADRTPSAVSSSGRTSTPRSRSIACE